jgi:coenzyme PQQ synthesis protein D (PqqD)
LPFAASGDVERSGCTDMQALRLRTGELSWREIDGEIVAVDVASSVYLSANSSGALLWQMLAAGTTRGALAAQLVDTFGIARERADADVAAFLDNLSVRNLLEE